MSETLTFGLTEYQRELLLRGLRLRPQRRGARNPRTESRGRSPTGRLNSKRSVDSSSSSKTPARPVPAFARGYEGSSTTECVTSTSASKPSATSFRRTSSLPRKSKPACVPVYERLGLPEGRLELMTGIRERRFFPGWYPSRSNQRRDGTARDRRRGHRPMPSFGALVHGSVCRDQLEPATASFVHHEADLPAIGLRLRRQQRLPGTAQRRRSSIANMIELGQIRAGVVVGTEDGRSLVEKHDRFAA